MLNHHRLGAGEPLLLIHGVGSHWQVFGPVLEPLAEHHDVIAVDLPGFGGSPPLPAGAEPGVPALTDAVTGLLDDLGLERVHVAGNSLGGWIALELVRRRRTRTALALAPAGFWTARERTWATTSLRGAELTIRRLRPALPRLARTVAGRRALLSLVHARPERVSPEYAVASGENLIASPGWHPTLNWLAHNHFTGAAEVAGDVVIAWGDRDRVLVPAQAERAVWAIPAARRVTLHGCGHLPMGDDPALTARPILAATGSE
jgi:pimeloyl-ACP methyl ester carboxylesterase